MDAGNEFRVALVAIVLVHFVVEWIVGAVEHIEFGWQKRQLMQLIDGAIECFECWGQLRKTRQLVVIAHQFNEICATHQR